MENKSINGILVDENLQVSDLINRIKMGGYKEEELSFFTELLSVFDREEELPVEQLKAFSASVILAYLENSHRYYMGKKMPEIELTLAQLSNNSTQVPEYLLHFFVWMRQNMEKHFRIEEKSLFPYIELLEKVSTQKEDKSVLKNRFKEFNIQRFVDSHSDEVENQLSEVKKQIIRSCSSVEELLPYRILIHKLDLFEKDLRFHARIEDEILVPKAIEWEKQL